jgi:HK97 family phage major capsid protein
VEYITREEKASRVTELKQGLARQAIEYPGVLPTDAQTTWDADSAEVDTLERDIRAWDNRQARLADYAQDETKVERTYEPVASFARKSVDDIYDLSTIERAGSEERRGQAYRDNAMRATDIASFPHPESKPDVFRSQIANLLDYKDSPNKELARRILMSTSPIYRRAFNKLCTGVPLSPEETRAAVAVVGTTTTGGYMVPAFFDPTVVGIGAFTSINPYRQACRVEQIVGGNKWTAVATGVVTPIRTTEAAVATEAGPTFEQPTLTAHRVTTLVTYSIETEQDRPDIASELAVVINEGKDTEEENEFTLGDGTGIHAFGMFSIHASVNGFFTHLHTAGAALAHDDAALTEATLPPRHRMNGAWFMSRGTMRAFQALEDVHGTLFGGQYYAYGGTPIPNANGNTGLRLLGYPVWEVPSAVSTTAVADSVIAALCDPKRFVVVDRVGMNVEIIPHILNGVVPTGQRGLFAMWRNTAGSFGAPGAATTGGIRLTVKS